MRIEVTLDLDEDLAAGFTAMLERGDYGSTPDALMMAALMALLDREADRQEEEQRFEEEDRLLDEAEKGPLLTNEEFKESMRQYWAERDARDSAAATAAE